MVKNKNFIGAHVSSSGGVWNAPINANLIGATGFALFVKNQLQWITKPLDNKSIELFKENMNKFNYSADAVLPHDSYLINLGSPNSESRKKSLKAFIDEVERVNLLGLKYLNFHPGSHLNEISETTSIKYIIDNLNKIIDTTENIILVIENTSGQGSNIGYRFEHLAEIINGIENKNRIGVCIDTCHLFSSGYDIRDINNYEKTMNKFEEIIGFKYLRAMHINDSKAKFQSRVDRHQNLGFGEIGLDAFKFIMNDKRISNIPLILETIDETLWEKEILMLKSFELNI
jgi:deoxyribonuclease-4